jgi:hypothetical protein
MYNEEMEKTRSPHLSLAQKYWKGLLKIDDLAIDATCGNGHDTLFLSELCTVVGLDIQMIAIQNTEILLAKHQRKALLYQISHEAIDTLPLPCPPKLVVYNLGYLPKGDKTITTKSETTLESLIKSFNILPKGGALSVTCYPGHEEGFREEKMIVEWARYLPRDKSSVCYHQWINRPNSPSLLWISKA